VRGAAYPAARPARQGGAPFRRSLNPFTFGRMSDDTLRDDLDALLARDELAHVERLALAAAIVSEALRARGLEATLVGGGAIEFHAPGSYATSDIDLVVERARPVDDLERALADSFEALGFARAGRHWRRNDVFVEVPSTRLTDPTESYPVGPYLLRVLRKEILLGERIVGFKHWRATGYGAQALDLMAAFGTDLDEAVLRTYLQREGAEGAYDDLRALAASGRPITDELLRHTMDSLTGESPG
jgi:hypothetical protein